MFVLFKFLAYNMLIKLNIAVGNGVHKIICHFRNCLTWLVHEIVLNKPLAELSCSHMPEEKILMHDWWLALIAAAFGSIGYLDEPTIDYRQHGNNVVGAKNTRSLSYILKKIRNDGVKTAMSQTYEQAKAFGSCFAAILNEQDKQLVQNFAAIADKNGICRRINFIKYGFFKYGIQRIIAQFIWG